ncbi:hypothetical protein BDY21DRAFT_335622 [Lineolata rhizophorae]|uniref:Protein kinase domain-containing protein n=1 Tax=Lineolata rhizophorae TaxID=578093 RepID=A0A6A6P9G2_9PEZI|nr:hypothetical protein BDY21DRAFT_335622 [Lineolata rhizophorae]
MSIHSPSLHSTTSIAQTTSQLPPHINEGCYAIKNVGLGAVGVGLTSLILRLDKGRVIKVPKTFTADDFPRRDVDYVEYMNDINREALELEQRIYKRLEDHLGIIRCMKMSSNGIELAFAKEGDLESYIKTNPEPHDHLKIKWILSLITTLSYIHSRRVFVDEIALRNVLVNEEQLFYSDFGNSCLLPVTADVDTACENGVTVKIEILHLGWIIYSIAVWAVHKYYYFGHGDPQWPRLQDLPPTDHVYCGPIIQKCWNGDYKNVEALNKDMLSLLAD